MSVVLTVPQVAEQLVVSEWTVYELIAKNELKSFDVSAGKRSLTRVRQSAVDDFIAKREKKRTAA
jgi:excisionase family DNA binding protein